MPQVHELDPPARQAIVNRLASTLRREPGLVFAVVYGSVLEPRGCRDIDVGIWLAECADPDTDVRLSVRLSEQAGFPVDVRRLNAAPTAFPFRALQGRPLVVNDDLFFANLIERTARVYHDIEPLLRQATREAFAS